MIVIATDFGCEGPYIGQMKAVLAREAPGVPVIDLFANLPAFEIQAAAYLLAAYVEVFEPGTVFLGIVDPGVGGARRAAAVCADGRWLVGPDNGLFNVVAQRAMELRWWDIDWRPPQMSHSFHGRDLFAPVAARLARGDTVPGRAVAPAARLLEGWPPELSKIVYVDHYGNLMTGIRAAGVPDHAILEAGALQLRRALTFSAVQPGEAFWYANANGLVEIAVNQGRASALLGLAVGDRVHFHGRL
ncbi:MAG: S-adenosyl-l-methionine hydroxide adenosyltransferase family protein [Gammaproteobacteria bacterium]